LRQAHAWLAEIARRLESAPLAADEPPVTGSVIRQRVETCLAELAGAVAEGRIAPWLHPAVAHLTTVLRRLGEGLYHCYDVPDLPRTNNDLEHVFGSARYHERRTTGRKTASPALVVRGSVRVIAAVATRQHPFRATDLCPRDLARWQELRQELEYRHEARRAQRRFRTDPAAYLAALEDQLLKSGLPA
jgi:hypothetical protein